MADTNWQIAFKLWHDAKTVEEHIDNVADYLTKLSAEHSEIKRVHDRLKDERDHQFTLRAEACQREGKLQQQLAAARAALVKIKDEAIAIGDYTANEKDDHDITLDHKDEMWLARFHRIAKQIAQAAVAEGGGR